MLLNSKLSFVQNILDKIPARFNVGIMAFFVTFISYVLRANLSMSILGMVKDQNPNVSGIARTFLNIYGIGTIRLFDFFNKFFFHTIVYSK